MASNGGGQQQGKRGRKRSWRGGKQGGGGGGGGGRRGGGGGRTVDLGSVRGACVVLATCTPAKEREAAVELLDILARVRRVYHVVWCCVAFVCAAVVHREANYAPPCRPGGLPGSSRCHLPPAMPAQPAVTSLQTHPRLLPRLWSRPRLLPRLPPPGLAVGVCAASQIWATTATARATVRVRQQAAAAAGRRSLPTRTAPSTYVARVWAIV